MLIVIALSDGWDFRMNDDIENKRIRIIEGLKSAKSNYLEVRQGINKSRETLDEIDKNVDRMISDVDKAIPLYGSIPRAILGANSTGLTTLINSGYFTSQQMSFHSERLKSSVFRIPEFLGSTNISIQATTTATANMSDIAYFTGVAALQIDQDNPDLKDAVEQARKQNPTEERWAFAEKLKTIEPRLCSKFEGMWQTLSDITKKDRHRQAAHSMREVLSEFLQVLSPDDEVKKAGWWKPETQNGKPSQRQRVKYAIIGAEKQPFLSDEDLNLIDALMNDARDRYEKLNEIAHARMQKAEELFPLLESYIENCQTLMAKILELREKHLKAIRFNP
jgi:hypothetical protein